LLTRLQVEGVTLHFFNDVFRLNLALESPQGVLDRFALLQSDFCQFNHPPARATHASLSLYYSAPLCRNSKLPTNTDEHKPRLLSRRRKPCAPRSRAQDPGTNQVNVHKEKLTLDSRIFVQCPIQDGRSHPPEWRTAPNRCTRKATRILSFVGVRGGDVKAGVDGVGFSGVGGLLWFLWGGGFWVSVGGCVLVVGVCPVCGLGGVWTGIWIA